VVWGIAGAWWLFALIWLFSRSAAPGAGSPARRIPAVLIYLAGLAAMVPAWLALGRVHVMSPGPWALVVVIAIVVAADIGAYFTGKLFGRHRLLPSVSPGKTWEGLFGGLAFASAVGWAAALSGVPLPPGMPVVAFCIALISVLGDLTVSLFKRNAGVKHSGTLLPGHGGVLDRIDSFCSAAPAWAVWITLTTDWL
jgi:phosphatidate cytidylyltransferase